MRTMTDRSLQRQTRGVGQDQEPQCVPDSRSFLQFDDRKFSPALVKTNDQRRRLLRSRPGISEELLALVDLPRRSPVESLMRTILLVPLKVGRNLSSHRFPTQWHLDPSEPFVFHRSKEPFDDRRRVEACGRAVAGQNTSSLAPVLEATAVELRPLVRDDVSARGGARKRANW